MRISRFLDFIQGLGSLDFLILNPVYLFLSQSPTYRVIKNYFFDLTIFSIYFGISAYCLVSFESRDSAVYYDVFSLRMGICLLCTIFILLGDFLQF